MTRNTILKLLEQLYQKENQELLNQHTLNEDFEQANILLEQLIQNTECNHSQNHVLEMRNLELQIIISNNNSVFNALKQTEQIEDFLEILTARHLPHTGLTLTCLSDIKNTFYKLYQLELKQIMMLISFEIGKQNEPYLISRLEHLLQTSKLNYPYFLGYDSMSEEINFTQIAIQRQTFPLDTTTKIEKAVYQRHRALHSKLNQVIVSNAIEKTIPTLKLLLEALKQKENHSSYYLLEQLWKKNLQEIENEIQNKVQPNFNQEIEGQLDLWSYQKTKKSSILDDSNN